MTSPLDPAAQRVPARFLDADGRLRTTRSEPAREAGPDRRSGGTVDV